MNPRHVCPIKRFITVVALIGLSLIQVAVSEPVTSRVAVLSFEMKGMTNGVDDWAAGLADLMEIELQRQNVSVYTRRYIGLVLKERQLDRTGAIRDGGLVRQALPDVDYLVKGRMVRDGVKQFTLDIQVGGVRSETEAQSFSGSGIYPKDIGTVIEAAAARIASGGWSTNALPKRTGTMPGFTRMPEAAVDFYRGIEYYCAGLPLRALLAFSSALNSDSSFLVAAYWRIRAYEALGLRDHVEFENTLLIERQQKAGIQYMAAVTSGVNRAKWVAPLFIKRKWEIPQPLIAEIKEGIRKQKGIQLFNPEWLLDFTDERDLRISGEFGLLENCDSRLWLQAEYMYIVTSEWDGNEPVFQARILNLFTGKGKEIGKIPKADIERLVAELTTAVDREQPDKIASAVEELKADPRPDIPKWPPQTPEGFRLAFQWYVQKPDDRDRIMLLYDNYPLEQMAQKRFLMRRYLSQIDPKEPDAVFWEGKALMKMWGANPASRDMKEVKRLFSTFIDKHPDTFEATCIRYTMASVLCGEKQYKEAQPLFVKVAEQFCAALPLKKNGMGADDNAIDPSFKEFLSGIFFMAAYTSDKIGDFDNAKRYLGLSDRYLVPGKSNFASGIYPNAANVGFDGTRLTFGAAFWGHSIDRKDFGGDPRIIDNSVDKTLQAMKTKYKAMNAASSSIEAIYTRVFDAREPNRLEQGFRYCAAVQKQWEEKSPEYDYEARMNEIPKVLSYLFKDSGPGRKEEIKKWGVQLSEIARTVPARQEILIASGNYDMARETFREKALMGDWRAFSEMGWIAKQEGGLPAEAQMYQDLYADMTPMGDVVSIKGKWAYPVKAAKTWKAAGEMDRAIACYETACGGGTPQLIAYFIHYQMALIENERGNYARAAELLKAIVRYGNENQKSIAAQEMLIADVPGQYNEKEIDDQMGALCGHALRLLDTIREKTLNGTGSNPAKE